MQKLNIATAVQQANPEHYTTIKAPTQNWIALTAIAITLLGFGFNAWRDVTNAKDDQSKLEIRVNEIQKTLEQVQKDNGKQFSDLRVSVAEINGKIEMLIQQNSRSISPVVAKASSHLTKQNDNQSVD